MAKAENDQINGTIVFSGGTADLQAAIQLLKEQIEVRKRKLPDIVPMPFPAKHWKTLILEDGKPIRRVYETAVVATLRDRQRRGKSRAAVLGGDRL